MAVLTSGSSEVGNGLDRAVVVLRSFQPDGRPMRLTDIVRKVGLPKTTTHRVVTELHRLGLLERDGHLYVLGRQLFELAELVPERRSLRETALPFMQDLFKATRGTVHLAVIDGLDALYIERIRGHHGVPVPSSVGGRLPLSSTGVGKALLAAAHPTLLVDVTSRPLRGLTSRSIVDPDVLIREIQEVRASGVGYDVEEASPGVGCAASPVVVRNQPVAALSVSVRLQDGDATVLRRIAPAVRITAAALASRLS
jgi:DNA-binding IclR family transcriptional regulator